MIVNIFLFGLINLVVIVFGIFIFIVVKLFEIIYVFGL